MNLKLTRDIVFFDIESTGLHVMRDRIVQIALIKISKEDNSIVEKSMLINPGIPISKEAMDIHGITPEMLSNKPTFKQVAVELFEFIGNSDLGGYNSDRFDIPMLMEEFSRCGLELNMDFRKNIDVQKIFYKMEPRTLKAALKYYCNEDLVDAHDALADVRATIDVLGGQIEKYRGVDHVDGDGFITKSPITESLDDIYTFTSDTKVVDVTQKLKYNAEGKIVFNFGKYMGQEAAPILYRDENYYDWILKKEFSAQVKQIVKKIVKEYANSAESNH